LGVTAARRARRRASQLALALAGTLPAAALAVRAARDALGADPIETLLHTTGAWALRFLVLALAVTPLRRWLGWSALAPCRRTLGLLAFAYACAHVATYAALDLGFAWGELAEDIAERPYITVGFASFLGMLPLALTSTRAAMRRLGRRWIALHRLVYAVAIGAVVHFAWGVKADLREPAVYAGIVALLFAARLRGPR
jgi:sulfoxide reductase heme-binding subunit YedZ